MRSVFIYFREVKLNDKNKVTINFSNMEIVYEIDFLTKNDYYITSLNCDLIVKEQIDNKDKLIKELLEKSRSLLKKGSAYQNDIN